MSLVNVVVFLSCILIPFTEGCANNVHQTMKEIFTEAKIVVYGKEVERYNASTDKLPGYINAKFQVFCVLNNKDKATAVKEVIHIKMVSPRNCSQTIIPTGKKVFLALKRNLADYEWDEVSSVDSAGYVMNSDTWNQVLDLWHNNLQFTFPEGTQFSHEQECPTERMAGGVDISQISYMLTILCFLTYVIISADF